MAACGEITVRDCVKTDVLSAAQHFEYKVAHFMDKAMESVFGYISVLPGAFSAYRYAAIRGDPLHKYFYVEHHTIAEMGPAMANMYLAEDRVLCFELISKKGASWQMEYVKDAIGITDAPSTMLELIKQRRRWLNGSLFSLIYYLENFMRVLAHSHHL